MGFKIKKSLKRFVLCTFAAICLFGMGLFIQSTGIAVDKAYAEEATTSITDKKVSIEITDVTSHTIKYKWSKVSGADGYKIRLYKKGHSDVLRSYTTTKTRLTLSELASARHYKLEIYAYDKQDDRTYSSKKATIVGHTKVKKPTIKSVVKSNKKLKITWKKSTRATKYKIYRKSGSGSYKHIKTVGNVSSYLDKGVSSTATYSYKIKACYTCCDKLRTSSYSNVKSKYYKKSSSSLNPMKTNKTTLDNKVKNILNSILKDGYTDKQKLKAIYRWTYKHMYYKFPNYKRPSSYYYSSKDARTVMEAELAIKNGYGVCNDYASVFQVLARRAGFEVYTVNKSATWGGQTSSHSWNMLRYKGKWYRIDPQIQRLKSGTSTDYTFFMQTDRTDWGVTYPKLSSSQITKGFGSFKLKYGKKSI